MVYVESPHLLSSFQRWALLHLHNTGGTNGITILKECCITAMTDSFGKKDVVEGLEKLAKMELISTTPPDAFPPDNRPDRELSGFYAITADGIIYTKKMLKPVLDLIVDQAHAERIAQRLTDGKTKSWLRNIANTSKDITQQQVLVRIIEFGLGNISGLSKLLDTLKPH